MTKRPRRYWARTPEGREHARRNARRWQIDRSLAPRCKATAKSTGERCGNPVIRGSAVCYLHGGLTPSKANWHKPRWPKKDTPAAYKKLQRKLRDLDRAARKREKRIAAMTPEEHARYTAWHAARQPGSAAKRRAVKLRRAQHVTAAEMAAILEARPANTPPEIVELNRRLDEARRQLFQLDNGNDGDVFG